MNLAANFFNGFLRKLAEERKLPLADLSEMFWAELKVKGEPGKNVLTTDGVHMNAEGNKLMARGVLKALGANEAELKKAEEAWSSIAPK
jgi:lysophospholipase L1-like esterase